MMTRAEMVADIFVRARISELRELAADTARTYAELIMHGVPADLASEYFSVEMLRQRLNEERGSRRR